MLEKHIIKVLKKETKLKDISLEIPSNPEFGDYAFPCFILSKKYKKNPAEIAQELSKKIKLDNKIKETKAIGPYLNFFINKEKLISNVIEQVIKEKNKTLAFSLNNKKYDYTRLLRELNSDNLEMFFSDKVVLVENQMHILINRSPTFV